MKLSINRSPFFHGLCIVTDIKLMDIMRLIQILSRPGGTKLNAIVEVHLDRILKAVLIFKGMMIEWVVVKGWEEELVKQDTGQPDIWGESRYHVRGNLALLPII